MQGLEKITPIDLRDYLKAEGWEQIQAAYDDGLYGMKHADFERRQLFFPIQPDAADYIESVKIALTKFAELRELDVHTLPSRILSAKNDGLRIRVHSRQDVNTLPLDFTSALVGSVEKLIKSSACTVLKPRISHPRLSHKEALDIVSHSKFGQTEQGSFVLNVTCPLNALDAQGSLGVDRQDDPFVRQVFQTMQEGLSGLVTSIERGTLQIFVDSLKKSDAPKVSANMCDALSSMHDENLGNSVDLNFLWSFLKPITDKSSLRPVRLQGDYFSRIEEVKQELKSSTDTQATETFIGTVERLDGDLGADGRRSGNVLLGLLLTDEEQTVRATVSLNPDQYADAVSAHQTAGAYVRVVARLKSGRQPRRLTELTDFQLIPTTPGI